MESMNPQPFEHVFHPTDFSRGDSGALAHALRVALSAQGKLHLLHVGTPDEDVHWEDFPHVRNWLEAWRIIPPGSSHEAVLQTGLHLRKIRRKSTDPVPCILEFMEDNTPDLVVLATHQRQGLLRWFHKSVAEPVARRSHVLSLFVPRRVQGFVSPYTGEVHLQNIVVPVDHTPNPAAGLAGLRRLLTTLNVSATSVSLVHAGPDAAMPKIDFELPPGWSVDRSCWEGEPVDHILRVAEDRDADLIVMTTEGRTGFLDAIRGSTTERVLRGARCPVLAVPAN